MTDQSDEEALRNFLCQRDTACPSCGYNLRDLQGQRCPECGSELQLQVGMVDMKQAAPIAGLIVLSMGGGMNGLLLIYLLITVLTKGSRGSFWWTFFWVNGTGFVVLGVAILGWLWLWRSIRRASALVRWGLVVLCAILTTIDLLVFTLNVR